MVKYFLVPRTIWFLKDLTVDKMKSIICSLNLTFLFCHVKNELGLTTWAGLGFKDGRKECFRLERVALIHFTIKATNRAETKKYHGQR